MRITRVSGRCQMGILAICRIRGGNLRKRIDADILQTSLLPFRCSKVGINWMRPLGKQTNSLGHGGLSKTTVRRVSKSMGRQDLAHRKEQCQRSIRPVWMSSAKHQPLEISGEEEANCTGSGNRYHDFQKTTSCSPMDISYDAALAKPPT